MEKATGGRSDWWGKATGGAKQLVGAKRLVGQSNWWGKAIGGVGAPSWQYTVHHPCQLCYQELRQICRGGSIRVNPVYDRWKEQSTAGVT